MNAGHQPEVSAAQDGPTTIRRGKTVALIGFSLLLVWHAASMVACVLPAGSEIQRVAYRPFERYLMVTGAWQRWQMFHSIPYNHDYDIEVVARDDSGNEHRLGFLLPDLGADKSHVRVYKLYVAFTDPGFKPYRDQFFENLTAAVGVAVPAAAEYEVVMTSHQMQGLEDISESGQISRPIEQRYGPFPVAQ